VTKAFHLLRLGRGRRQGRLVRHYFLVWVIVISMGLITSGLLEMYFRHRESLAYFGLVQQEVAAAAAFKIEQFVHEVERSMRAATRTREIVRDGLSPDYKWELRRLLANVRSITEVIAFDLKGVQRAGAWRLRPLLPADIWPPPSTVLEKIRRGESQFGPVDLELLGPALIIAVPIERLAGEVIGVLQAGVDLKYAGQVISSARVGKAGQAYLVTESGLLIAHSDLSLVLQKRNLAHLAQTKVAFQPVSSTARTETLVTDNMLDERVLASYAFIPSLGWAVFAEQPIAEVHSSLYASAFRTSALLLIGLGVALLATLFVSRRVVRPLETLRHGVERIRGGDLTTRLDVKTGDELELLADEFNAMAAHLRQAYAGLERTVAERTQALTVANAKLEEASRHKSQFLAHVNHELRTPVSAIIGYARLMLRATKAQISPLQRENLQDLLNNAERLLTLIDSLLEFAKIEAGKVDVRLEAVNVAEVIRGAVSTIEPVLHHGAVRLIRDIAPSLPVLNTDRDKLRQIILNLLDNAAKYTERGEIRISASQHNGRLELVVADTGVGIEQAQVGQIFEEFARGDSSTARNLPGTGLGLTIVQRFVFLLGGDIRVTSEVGKGSSFTVVIPFGPRESTSH
jgi:signal transduction histidine kinase